MHNSFRAIDPLLRTLLIDVSRAHDALMGQKYPAKQRLQRLRTNFESKLKAALLEKYPLASIHGNRSPFRDGWHWRLIPEEENYANHYPQATLSVMFVESSSASNYQPRPTFVYTHHLWQSWQLFAHNNFGVYVEQVRARVASQSTSTLLGGDAAALFSGYTAHNSGSNIIDMTYACQGILAGVAILHPDWFTLATATLFAQESGALIAGIKGLEPSGVNGLLISSPRSLKTLIRSVQPQ